MRAVTAKKLLKQARKNARTGKVVIRREYDRLKKELKQHTNNPKIKLTKRQGRIKISREFTSDLRKSNPGFRAIPGAKRKFAPKKKAHRF
jgi:hypothetical protein